MLVVTDTIRRMMFPLLMVAIVAGLWITAEMQSYQVDLRASSAELELPSVKLVSDEPAAPVWLVLDDAGYDGSNDVDPT